MAQHVLVLNATYEPLNVCSVRRACVLLLKEKAEVVAAVGSRDPLSISNLPSPDGHPPDDLRAGAAAVRAQDHAQGGVRPGRLVAASTAARRRGSRSTTSCPARAAAARAGRTW